MKIETVLKEFKEKVCEQISIESEGLNRYIVNTPFKFDDGDHLVIILKHEDDKWALTDEAHTFMHLSYMLDVKDLEYGTRKSIIDDTLKMFSVFEIDGELKLQIPNSEFGNALYSYIQALLKITDIPYLSRERAKSTFIEDFKHYFSKRFEQYKPEFEWTPEKDMQKKYVVDCKLEVNGKIYLVFALQNDLSVAKATINLLTFEKWNLKFNSIGIYEEPKTIQDDLKDKLTDVVVKQYTSLSEDNEDRIYNYVTNQV